MRPWTPLFRYPHDGAAAARRMHRAHGDYECARAGCEGSRGVDFGLRVIVADPAARRSGRPARQRRRGVVSSRRISSRCFAGDNCGKLKADGS